MREKRDRVRRQRCGRLRGKRPIGPMNEFFAGARDPIESIAPRAVYLSRLTSLINPIRFASESRKKTIHKS